MVDKSIGEVAITLDGKERTLQCSLAAAKMINASANGFQGMLGRLGMMDFDAYVIVVAAGLNVPSRKIEEKVYRSGMPSLTGSLVEFVTYLSNGGKPFLESDTIEKKEDPEGEA